MPNIALLAMDFLNLKIFQGYLYLCQIKKRRAFVQLSPYVNVCVSRKVVVAGAGYIAVELAGVLKELGSDVTLLIRRNQVNF